MKKVIVIGCPGSGKSTFSRELHRVTALPLHHLDMMYWNADRTTVEKNVFRERLAAVLGTDAWIIDGNYGSTMELRLALCDTVVFLDYPPEICLDGVRARRGKPRSDMPWIETEEDAEFIEFVRSYNDRERPKVLELLEKYSDKNTVTEPITTKLSKRSVSKNASPILRPPPPKSDNGNTAISGKTHISEKRAAEATPPDMAKIHKAANTKRRTNLGSES